MNIQYYDPHRALEIADLFCLAVHNIDNAIYDADQKEVWAPSPPDYDHWIDRLSVKQPFMAIIDDQVAGFIELDTNGHIDCAYTHPRFQRQGVASGLYRFLENEARKKKLSRLYVEASIIAMPFFKKHGFSLVRENEINRKGVTLVNYTMEKLLAS
ncbi:histone acetyltransferase [Hahella sp. CCB-MM4]|uniref:GNAT family N-acetyltransferase n=1 Tax=Hahella sp. (strain CCB-MM4) TaxID=1926491 RepID=UPI000B9BF9C1|nr:GNAT family N-acetyltransferase [Hahella sp. CCB-MM4]OZG75010.1 histone acetyltransferase [Hahella sp. CCB-MM4]